VHLQTFNTQRQNEFECRSQGEEDDPSFIQSREAIEKRRSAVENLKITGSLQTESRTIFHESEEQNEAEKVNCLIVKTSSTGHTWGLSSFDAYSHHSEITDEESQC
jgi:hypothetical protein